MKVGVAIKETWAFFNEVYDEINQHHQVSQFQTHKIESPFFQERINRAIFRRDMQTFLKSNDVAFFEWSSDLLASATRFPKTCGIITRLHRYEMYQWVEKIHWEKVDKIILVSQAKQREFNRRFPLFADRTVVIPESISLGKFSPAEKPFTKDIGILCHLTPRKRVYELILAFTQSGLEWEGYRLHIGGGKHPRFGDYYEAMQRLVERLGLQEKVIFYGNVEDPAAWYRNIDIFISNSYSEGLQVSPMEAIASGCYCLSHEWDGADELLGPEALYTTDNELAEHIRAYANMEEKERKIARYKQRERVTQNFNSTKIKVQIRELVEQVGEKYKQGIPT